MKMQNAAVATASNNVPEDWDVLLGRISKGTTALTFGENDTIFVQGQPADSLYFVVHGKVRLAVTSQDGKEAIVATLSRGKFFGEGCLAGQPLRLTTATSVGSCALAKVDKP